VAERGCCPGCGEAGGNILSGAANYIFSFFDNGFKYLASQVIMALAVLGKRQREGGSSEDDLEENAKRKKTEQYSNFSLKMMVIFILFSFIVGTFHCI